MKTSHYIHCRSGINRLDTELCHCRRRGASIVVSTGSDCQNARFDAAEFFVKWTKFGKFCRRRKLRQNRVALGRIQKAATTQMACGACGPSSGAATHGPFRTGIYISPPTRLLRFVFLFSFHVDNTLENHFYRFCPIFYVSQHSYRSHPG